MSANTNSESKRLYLGISFLIAGIGIWLLFAAGIGFEKAIEISFPTVYITLGITHVIEEVKARMKLRKKMNSPSHP